MIRMMNRPNHSRRPNSVNQRRPHRRRPSQHHRRTRRRRSRSQQRRRNTRITRLIMKRHTINRRTVILTNVTPMSRTRTPRQPIRQPTITSMLNRIHVRRNRQRNRPLRQTSTVRLPRTYSRNRRTTARNRRRINPTKMTHQSLTHTVDLTGNLHHPNRLPSRQITNRTSDPRTPLQRQHKGQESRGHT